MNNELEKFSKSGLRTWLLEHGAKKEIIDHETFREQGLLREIFDLTKMTYQGAEAFNYPEVNMSNDMITMIFNRNGLISQELSIAITDGNLYVNCSIEEKNKTNQSKNKQITSLQILKEKDRELEVIKSYTYMDSEAIRIDRERKESRYSDDGLETFYQLSRKEDTSFFLKGQDIGNQRVAAATNPYQSPGNQVHARFMAQYNRTDFGIYGLNAPDHFVNPDYIENAARVQYNVADVYVKNNVSHTYPNQKDMEFRVCVPLDQRNLDAIRLPYDFSSMMPGDQASRYIESPYIPPMTEEEISLDIQNSGCTEKQKQALLQMAQIRNRKNFNYLPGEVQKSGFGQR